MSNKSQQLVSTVQEIKLAKIELQAMIRNQIEAFSAKYNVEIIEVCYHKYRATTLDGNRQYYYDIDLRIEL